MFDLDDIHKLNAIAEAEAIVSKAIVGVDETPILSNREIAAAVLEEGGITLTRLGRKFWPFNGTPCYAVSVYGSEVRLPASVLDNADYCDSAIWDAAISYAKRLAGDRQNVGIWLDGDYVLIDVTRIYVGDGSENRAFEFGKANQQHAIYDFGRACNRSVDTGEVL